MTPVKYSIWGTTKGSDKNKLFLAYRPSEPSVESGYQYEFQYLVDGEKYRLGNNPKRKNLRHCQLLGFVFIEENSCIDWEVDRDQEYFNCVNAKIRKIIKRAKGEIDVKRRCN